MVRNITVKFPKHAPGKGVAKAARRQAVWMKAAQLDASDFSGYGTTQLVNMPADTMVTEILVNISEAFTASVTLTIGDGADVDRFLDSASIAPQTAGFKSSKQDGQPASGGHIYATADSIDLVVAGATPSAGTIDVWFSYISDVSELDLNTGQ